MNPALLEKVAETVRRAGAPAAVGRVARLTGLTLEAHVPGARVGDAVEVEREGGAIPGEVIGFKDGLATIVPFHEPRGVAPGARVHRRLDGETIGVGDALLGRIVDPFGIPLDEQPAPTITRRVPILADAPRPGQRARIDRRFETGVRVIDGLLPCGRGQRVGIFAGAGVGKTVLVRQILAQSTADVVVVGLVGERGCEVLDLLHAHPSDRTVMVVATSDRSPMERTRGALAATAIAEHFRDQGKHVLLVIDSLTRYAMAMREIGLSAGEPPATKGYPPSVFAALPRLLERVAPLRDGGSITAFYTVLVEGDDLSDPVADSARSLLDAHIVLGRELAGRGHFPAVDVIASASRVARQVSDGPALDLQQRARAALAKRRDVEELRSLGAYVPGQNATLDRALAIGERLDGWSAQRPEDRSPIDATLTGLARALGDPTEERR